MTLPGETILTGAEKRCPGCGIKPKVEVCRSNAGYYLGTMCNCGPYSRESKYYPTFDDAAMMLELWKDGNYVDARYL